MSHYKTLQSVKYALNALLDANMPDPAGSLTRSQIDHLISALIATIAKLEEAENV